MNVSLIRSSPPAPRCTLTSWMSLVWSCLARPPMTHSLRLGRPLVLSAVRDRSKIKSERDMTEFCEIELLGFSELLGRDSYEAGSDGDVVGGVFPLTATVAQLWVTFACSTAVS